MAMQQVEYEFPDPDAENTEVEITLEEEEDNSLEIEGAVGRENMKTPKKDRVEELEIEIEDDTPEADRGRKASAAPEEVTDDELENYSDKVKKRIQHLSKGYHDERRAKETAMREREELERFARQAIEENKELRSKTDQSHNSLIESAKKQVAGELEMAGRQYKEAYESGDSEAILKAQSSLNTAQIRTERVNALKPKVLQPLQPQVNPVQSQELAPQPPQRDQKAREWADENTWFGSKTPEGKEMTSFAFGVHGTLVEAGVDPRSDEYYEKINTRMRQVFPNEFDIQETKKKTSNVVAPATRSTSPRKVTLKQSQVAIAKRLGIPLEEYAKQAAKLMRKQ
tara:strand:- start:99 stop:1121 length:1023 start_codon:yes stop_codon:yes gene_type:complete